MIKKKKIKKKFKFFLLPATDCNKMTELLVVTCRHVITKSFPLYIIIILYYFYFKYIFIKFYYFSIK